jgi:hypothetical protein
MVTAEARLDARLDGVAPHHAAAQAALRELLADLGASPELGAREIGTASDGSKGSGVELIVSLGASGTLAAVVRVIQLWLGRDRRRSLTVSVRSIAEGKTVSIEGDNVSVGALTDALGLATQLDQGSETNAEGAPRPDLTR